jgi:hypothetical protein
MGYGHLVLGGLDDLQKLLARQKIHRIIIVASW